MKKIYLLICCLFALTAFGQNTWDSTYYGNGKTGFGGTLGQGSLKIEFAEDSVLFTFRKGPGALNDVVVIYIQGDVNEPDPERPGFSSTTNFTDVGDGLRRAISGFSSSGRSVLKFAAGFMPNMAFAFSSDSATAYEPRENGEHVFMMNMNLRPTGDKNAEEYRFSMAMGDDNNGDENTFTKRLKKTASEKEEFRFLVTYISETGYRSNEFIGDNGPIGDPGFSDYEATSYAIGYSPAEVRYESEEYDGNHQVGFGGAVGNGRLRIKVKNDSLFFIFRKGNGDFNDIVVIYAQGDVSKHSTGISSTANFTDFSDPFTRAISGYDGINRSVLTFANKFKPEGAFVFDKNHASSYDLIENGPHAYGGAISFRIQSYSPYDIDYIIGVKAFTSPVSSEEVEHFMDNYGFLVNYVRADGFRSNEFIGDPGPSTNPGWGDYVSTTFIGDNDPIPVTLLSFQGISQQEGVNLQWRTSQESNIDGYEILRSSDGKNFSKIGWVKANNLSTEQVYYFQDANPFSGDNFYKLGILNADGKIEFSKIISLKAGSSNSFKAYTTSSNRVLKIELNSPVTENYVVEMTNSIGQKIFQYQLKPNGSNTYSLDLNKTLSTGIYSIIISRSGESFIKMIMVK